MAKKTNWNLICQEVYKNVGKKPNISAVTACQTRLRINVKNLDLVNTTSLKNVSRVLGVHLAGEQVQIIFGPGSVTEAYKMFQEIVNFTSLSATAKTTKVRQQQQNNSRLQQFIGKFSGIFAPLVLGFIGAGILSGIAGIIQSAVPSWEGHNTAQSWYQFLSVLINIWKATFLVIVGWRTAAAFGGSGVLGAIIAGLYVAEYGGVTAGIFIPVRDGTNHVSSFNFLGFNLSPHNWFLQGFRPEIQDGNWVLSYPSGSIFGVMSSAILVGRLENICRRFIPNFLDSVLNPTLVLTTLLVLNFVLIFPVSGYVFLAVSFMFQNLYANPFGTALLASLFLIAVVFGIHQGFIPVYATLVATTGVNGLFPVLSMAGAAQVGMALALYRRSPHNSLLRKQIKGAIIPAFFGIGEPLIYGVSLPRIKPFITSCIGAGLAGFSLGAWNLWGGDPVGLNTLFGPSGLLAIPLLTTVNGVVWKGIVIYIASVFLAYGCGFIITYWFGYQNVDLD